MPLYEYRCNECGAEFEMMLRFSEADRRPVCPKCESSIKRMHRNIFDRFLSRTFMPNSRRYRCTNSECGWSGLRKSRYHIPRLHFDEVNQDRMRF